MHQNPSIGIQGERDQGQDVRTSNGILIKKSDCNIGDCKYSEKYIRAIWTGQNVGG